MRNAILANLGLGWMGGALLGATFCLAGMPTVAQAQDVAPSLDNTYPNYQPAYPDTAQVNGEQGNVILNVQVSTSGKVRNIQIVQSSGFPDLDNAAVAGVMRWRYHPAIENGDTATSWTKVTITYHLPTAMPLPPKLAPKG